MHVSVVMLHAWAKAAPAAVQALRSRRGPRRCAGCRCGCPMLPETRGSRHTRGASATGQLRAGSGPPYGGQALNTAGAVALGFAREHARGAEARQGALRSGQGVVRRGGEASRFQLEGTSVGNRSFGWRQNHPSCWATIEFLVVDEWGRCLCTCAVPLGLSFSAQWKRGGPITC